MTLTYIALLFRFSVPGQNILRMQQHYKKEMFGTILAMSVPLRAVYSAIPKLIVLSCDQGIKPSVKFVAP
jgi:hypothetical protein